MTAEARRERTPNGSKLRFQSEDGEAVLWPIGLCLFSADLGVMEGETFSKHLVAFVLSQTLQKPVTNVYLVSFPFVH